MLRNGKIAAILGHLNFRKFLANLRSFSADIVSASEDFMIFLPSLAKIIKKTALNQPKTPEKISPRIAGKIVSASILICLLCTPLLTQAGTIYGTVSLEGEPPPIKKLIIDKDEYCKRSAKGRVSEALILSRRGGVKNAVVSISGVKGDFSPPDEVVLIDQSGCNYNPHVTVIQAGTPVDVRNSDTVNHNVRSNPEENDPINYAMPEPMVIPLPDLMNPESIRVTCDIHKWMNAYLVVTENPFFSLTGKEGKFEIVDLPEGSHEIHVWHETLGVQKRIVVVPASGKIDVNFIFKTKGAR